MGNNKKNLKELLGYSDEEKKITESWFRLYRIKRSKEFNKQYDAKKSWDKIDKKIYSRKLRRIIYLSTTAAASIALIFLTFYFIQTPPGLSDQEIALINFPETGGKKATLILNDGEEVNLNTTDHSTKERLHAIGIVKADESITYQKSKEKDVEKVMYNTLSIPRGGEFHLILSDGTKVWLNSESTLRYPTHFSTEREVTLTGEGYFEVAKEKAPFIVNIRDGKRVEVLGTKFNISAYTDNPIYTTLVEGKVKVSQEQSFIILSPNQQALLLDDHSFNVIEVDAELFTSWTQGLYKFQSTKLSDIVNQLSRWYDVDIQFKDKQLIDRRFTGAISRNNELGYAIFLIEKISNVKFITENDTIYIINNPSPKN